MSKIQAHLGYLPLLGCLSLLPACTTSAGGDHRGNSSSAPSNSNVVGPNGTGTGAGGGTGVAGVAMGVGGSGMAVVVPAGAVVGPTMLRRLTNIEYRNTVQSLLGSPGTPTDALSADSLTNGFDNFSASLTVPPAAGTAYAALAASVALNAFTAPACPAPMTETECAQSFIGSFGKRAFRRPLTPDEITVYTGLYTDQRTRGDHRAGLRQVVQTMLQSPHLLYRFELGSPNSGAQRTLSSYEVATQLAFMLTASTPDDTLLAAADGNALATPTQIEQQARRLLSLPQAKASIQRFLLGFADTLGLGLLSKDAAVYPVYTSQLRSAMEQETARFVDAVVWEGDGSYSSLLTAPYSYVNSDLASFYGITDPGQGVALVKTTLKPSERMGLLTQASVLAAHSKPGESSPVKRGKFVRVGLLCQPLPAPPAIVPTLQPPQPNLTTRERFAQHSTDAACSGCHHLIDPLGFGFENYDGVGQFRSAESGKPVDASGAVTGSLDIDGPYTGAIELSNKLAVSQEAKQCLALRAYGWAFGRSGVDGERPVVNSMVEPLAANGLDIRELMLAITQSNNFLFRTFR